MGVVEKVVAQPTVGDHPLRESNIPKLRIAAFCETAEMMDTVDAAAADRRMMRTVVESTTGGTRSAIEQYRQAASPDLIILERKAPGDLLIEELERLADGCDVGTKVLVIGVSNDIALYRDLLNRGVSDYLVGPVDAPGLIAAIGRIYDSPDAKKLGRTYAFIGAKGGVGSSTIAHNVAATIANRFDLDVILADLDLPFGTAGLDFNLDSTQGVAEALDSAGDLDELLLDRLLGKCSNRLSMLAAPVTLEQAYDFDEAAFDNMLDAAKLSSSHIVLDVPHLWTSWARRVLISADEVVVTAGPDLANLRNAKTLLGILQKARPNDAPPKLVLNQIGLAKRPEIKPADFAKALKLDPSVCIPFDAKVFGAAANKGQMIADIAAKPAAPFGRLAEALLEGSGIRNKREPRGALRRLFTSGRTRSA